MDRISRDDLHIGIVQLISQRGTCGRGKVGCIILRNNRIISSGYNGVLHGTAPCSEEFCDLNFTCKRAVHAEVNAIAAAAKMGISLDGCVLVTTHAPCINCALVISQSGIREVLYKNEYKNKEGVDTLIQMGISVRSYDGN